MNNMKLDELFNINNRFMNVELRDFLNLNENGTDIYTWNDVNHTGWREVVSLGSQMHQLTAPNTQSSIIVGYYNNKPIYKEVYTRLNAKFCHTDGREAVFKYKKANEGEIITKYPDKGTYNYSDDLGNDFILGVQTLIPDLPHDKYDVDPYNEHMEELKKNEEFKRNIEELTRQNGGNKSNISMGGNSYFWRFD